MNPTTMLNTAVAELLREFGYAATYKTDAVSVDTYALIRPLTDKVTPFGVKYTELGRVETKQYLAYILPLAGVDAADMANGQLVCGDDTYDIFDANSHKLQEVPVYLSLILTKAA